MEPTYTQEMLIGICAACAVGGILVGLLAGRFLLRSKHAATLERELNEAREAMKDYKAEVFQQFGDTAKKFEKLNESYADLHKQLATSASVLCADMPDVPLLAGSSTTALPEDAPIEVPKDASPQTEAEATSPDPAEPQAAAVDAADTPAEPLDAAAEKPPAT